MKRIIILVTALAALQLISPVVAAETRYLSDQQKVWTRTGPGNNYKVKFQIVAGTQLKVLQQDQEAGFVEVEDDKGRTGWLKASSLVTERTAGYKLRDAVRQLEQLNKEVKTLRPLVDNNKQLQDKFAGLQVEIQQLQEQNQIFRSRFNSEIFFAGGITVVVGLFIGFLIGRASRSKKNSGWS